MKNELYSDGLILFGLFNSLWVVLPVFLCLEGITPLGHAAISTLLWGWWASILYKAEKTPNNWRLAFTVCLGITLCMGMIAYETGEKYIHKCVDKTHLTCDGKCTCDGFECN